MKNVAFFGAGRIHGSNLAALPCVQLHDFDIFRRILCADGDEADTPGSTGMVQAGNQRLGEVLQSDAHGVRAGKPFRTTIEDGVAAQSLESGEVIRL